MKIKDMHLGLRHIIVKSVINLIIVLLFSVFLIVSLNLIQNAASRQEQRNDSIRILDEIAETIETNKTDAAQLEQIFHISNRETLNDLKTMFTSGLLDSYVSISAEERASRFSDIIDRTGVKYLFVMNATGDIMLYSNADAVGKNLLELNILTSEQIEDLVEGRTVDWTDGSNSLYFYATSMKSEYGTFYIVMGEDSSILDEQYNSLTNIGDLISGTSVAGTGFVFAVDSNAKTFLYYNDGEKDMSGQNISDCGLNVEILKDNYSGTQNINGKEYYCVSRQCGTMVIITAAVATQTIYADNYKVVFWSATLFIMTAIVSLLYAIFVRNDLIHQQIKPELKTIIPLKNGNRIVSNRSVGKKVFPVMAVGLLLIFGASFYVQTLLSLSNAIKTSTNTISEIENKVDHAETLRSDIKSYYESRYLARTKLISYMLEVDPSALNDGTKLAYSEYDDEGVRQTVQDDEGNALKSIANSQILQNLCDSNDMESIYVYNNQGHTIAANTDYWYFTVSRDENDQSYPFLQVLDGRLSNLIQDAQADENGEQHQYVGTAFNYYTTKDSQGNTVYASLSDYESQQAGTWTGNPITQHSSMIQSAVSNSVMSHILNSTDVTYVVDNTSVYQNGFILVFDSSEEHNLLCSPYTDGTKNNAADLGLNETCFSGSYNGFRKINDVNYFLCCRLYDGYYLCTAIPTGELYSLRLRISLITAIISLVCLMIMCSLVVFTTDNEEKLYQQMSDNASDIYRDDRVTVTTTIGDKKITHSTQSAVVRMNGRWRKWFIRTPEQKLIYLLGICGILLTIYILLTMFGISSTFNSESILKYIISGEWEHSVGIFSLTACGILLITILVGVNLLRTLIVTVTGILGIKSETMGKLLISILKYGSTLAGLFYCLYMIGLDASSLIASAGILSVVIGLGAQSLIGDILAGIFIVFEGEFRVGDIVTIDEFRGHVLEIGLRTTKVVDTTQNIKIFNNSKISGVLNMTKRISYARCEVGVSYGQPLEEIELVLKEELPNVRKSIPILLKDPEYKGVLKLADSGVVIRIEAECLEGDRLKALRALNREILLIFNRHGIDIPFPQVTLSMLKDNEHEVTDAMRKAAKDFALKQLHTQETSNDAEDDDDDDSDSGEES